MAWSMTVVRNAETIVVHFNDAEVVAIEAAAAGAADARVVLFGMKEQFGWWRVLETDDCLKAAGRFAKLLGRKTPALARKFDRIVRFLRKGKRGGDTWIGVG